MYLVAVNRHYVSVPSAYLQYELLQYHWMYAHKVLVSAVDLPPKSHKTTSWTVKSNLASGGGRFISVPMYLYN